MGFYFVAVASSEPLSNPFKGFSDVIQTNKTLLLCKETLLSYLETPSERTFKGSSRMTNVDLLVDMKDPL